MLPSPLKTLNKKIMKRIKTAIASALSLLMSACTLSHYEPELPEPPEEYVKPREKIIDLRVCINNTNENIRFTIKELVLHGYDQPEGVPSSVVFDTPVVINPGDSVMLLETKIFKRQVRPTYVPDEGILMCNYRHTAFLCKIHSLSESGEESLRWCGDEEGGFGWAYAIREFDASDSDAQIMISKTTRWTSYEDNESSDILCPIEFNPSVEDWEEQSADIE